MDNSDTSDQEEESAVAVMEVDGGEDGGLDSASESIPQFDGHAPGSVMQFAGVTFKFTSEGRLCCLAPDCNRSWSLQMIRASSINPVLLKRHASTHTVSTAEACAIFHYFTREPSAEDAKTLNAAAQAAEWGEFCERRRRSAAAWQRGEDAEGSEGGGSEDGREPRRPR